MCDLRATLTAERRSPTDATGARVLLPDTRFSLGEARLDLRVLLAMGVDVRHKALTVRSKAKALQKAQLSAAAGGATAASQLPTLIVSLEGVDTLGAIARAARLPAHEALEAPSFIQRAKSPAASVAQQRWAKVRTLQAVVRGYLARKHSKAVRRANAASWARPTVT